MRLGKRQVAVLRALASHDELLEGQLMSLSGLVWRYQYKARLELIAAGLVGEEGDRYRITDAGREALSKWEAQHDKTG